MTRIKKLYYLDRKNARELRSFLNNSDLSGSNFLFNPFLPLHNLLPLKIKFLPESYVLKDNKDIKALITMAPNGYPLRQMEIQRLLFEENCYDNAAELVQYAISRYKAMGTSSVIVRVDDRLPDLLRMFISKCGFIQISYEKLWKITRSDEIEHLKYNPKMYRIFRGYDAQVVANLYNEQLLPHFRPLLRKEAKEYRDSLFKGISYYNEYKYVLSDRKYRNIVAYISIKTSDNENYVLDLVKSSWEDINMDLILAFAHDQIRKRNKNYNLYIKTKRYVQKGDTEEQYLMEKKYECIQNQVVLTNSSAGIIKSSEQTRKFTVLNQLYGGIGAINKG